MLCPAAGEDSTARPGLRLGHVLPTAGSSSLSCNALLLPVGLQPGMLCVQEGTGLHSWRHKKASDWMHLGRTFFLCSLRWVTAQKVQRGDVPGEGSTRSQHPSWL